MIFNVTSGSGGGGSVAVAGSWEFCTATAKPATVSKRTMLAVCATAPTTITVSDAEPASPAANDVWFHVFNPEDGRAMSDGSVPIKCWGAYQYVDGAWSLLTAYYEYLGAWWELPGLPPVGTALADCSWDQINRIGAAGKATDYFCVGDEKDITLSTAETVTLQIIGFGHDDLSAASGGKAPITFGMKDCLAAKSKINNTDINKGGYSGSAFYQTLTTTIWGTLPEELRSVAKQVTKRAAAGNNSLTIVPTAEKIFLLADVEINGSCTWSAPGEGTQYAMFASGSTKVKKVSDVAAIWWTRSPNASSNNTVWCCMTAAGAATRTGPSSSFGISFTLCV